MTGRLLDDEPENALAHARAARAMTARIGVVREAVGLAAYAMEQWTEALAELRAARRITGRPDHLAVFADCERALGRPERALAHADDPAVSGLPQDERVELVIVLAGARADMGQAEAAVLTLQEPALRTSAKRSWAGRLWYAYADALTGAGRPDEAREWFARVVELDDSEATDAVDRLLELDGVELLDLADGAEDETGGQGEVEPDADLAAYIRETYGVRPGPVPNEPEPDVETSSIREGSIPPVDELADVRESGAVGSGPGKVVPPAFLEATPNEDPRDAGPAPVVPSDGSGEDRGPGEEHGPLRLFD